MTLNNQGATTAGTTAYYYQYNTTKVINGVTCYYYTDQACTTPLSNGYYIVLPTRTGYTFGGYFVNADGTGTQYVDAGGLCINNIYGAVADNTTLYAKWTANLNTITLNVNDGDWAGKVIDYSRTTKITVSTGTTDNEFSAISGQDGWYKNNNKNVNSSTAITIVTIVAPKATTVKILYYVGGESGCDKGYISDISTSSSSDDLTYNLMTNNKQNYLDPDYASGYDTKTFEITSAGTYYIGVKYTKDVSNSRYLDGIHFKVITGEQNAKATISVSTDNDFYELSSYDGWYRNGNAGEADSVASTTITITATAATKVCIYYYKGSEGADHAYISSLSKTTTFKYGDALSDNYTSEYQPGFTSGYSTKEFKISSAGTYYIGIKYTKDYSVDTYIDGIYFKVVEVIDPYYYKVSSQYADVSTSADTTGFSAISGHDGWYKNNNTSSTGTAETIITIVAKSATTVNLYYYKGTYTSSNYVYISELSTTSTVPYGSYLANNYTSTSTPNYTSGYGTKTFTIDSAGTYYIGVKYTRSYSTSSYINGIHFKVELDMTGATWWYISEDGTTATRDVYSGEVYDLPQIIPSETDDSSDNMFVGWYTSASGGTRVTSTMLVPEGGTTLYAICENVAIYTITYKMDSGTNATSNPTTYNKYDLPLTISAATYKTGHYFTGWTGANGTTKQTTVTIPEGTTGNLTYTANWTKERYYITFSGYSSLNGYYYYLDDVEEPTWSGHKFEGWYTASSGGTHLFDSYVGDLGDNGDSITVYAQWVEAVTLTVIHNKYDTSSSYTTTTETYLVAKNSTVNPDSYKNSYDDYAYMSSSPSSSITITSNTTITIKYGKYATLSVTEVYPNYTNSYSEKITPDTTVYKSDYVMDDGTYDISYSGGSSWTSWTAGIGDYQSLWIEYSEKS